MNAVSGCYKTQGYTAKYPAVLHGGLGNGAIGNVSVEAAKEAFLNCTLSNFNKYRMRRINC